MPWWPMRGGDGSERDADARSCVPAGPLARGPISARTASHAHSPCPCALPTSTCVAGVCAHLWLRMHSMEPKHGRGWRCAFSRPRCEVHRRRRLADATCGRQHTGRRFTCLFKAMEATAMVCCSSSRTYSTQDRCRPGMRAGWVLLSPAVFPVCDVLRDGAEARQRCGHGSLPKIRRHVLRMHARYSVSSRCLSLVCGIADEHNQELRKGGERVPAGLTFILLTSSWDIGHRPSAAAYREKPSTPSTNTKHKRSTTQVVCARPACAHPASRMRRSRCCDDDERPSALATRPAGHGCIAVPNGARVCRHARGPIGAHAACGCGEMRVAMAPRHAPRGTASERVLSGARRPRGGGATLGSRECSPRLSARIVAVRVNPPGTLGTPEKVPACHL